MAPHCLAAIAHADLHGPQIDKRATSRNLSSPAPPGLNNPTLVRYNSSRAPVLAA